ncbi:PD-(D/E)XK motif protein [Pseudodesulfovibrio indicus]|uniref:PD-(D/E)XK motif protein n=1 Tax=Pseudodesulfovibrio indicus TaxID=1716143 RepID=UPI00292F0A80|nr:PD-(D/E)XK motif protein [Pseudodesulfovibrio indicus]
MPQQEYPWKSLSASRNTNISDAIKVDGSKHDFYWARSHEGLPQLICKLPEAVPLDVTLPTFNGIEARLVEAGGECLLVMQLTDMTFEQLFYHLCLNLIESTRSADSAAAIVAVIAGRLKRWQKLLGKKSVPGMLTRQEQQGLMGELFFLRDKLFDWTGYRQAVECWVAPDEHPQDFALPGPTSVEVKCRQTTSPDMVKISSAWQLHQEDGDIVLAVLALGKGKEESAGHFTLASLVEDIRQTLASTPDASELFEDALFGWGYIDLPEYNVTWWQPASWRAYGVDGSFPKLTVLDLKQGIVDVSYRLSLPDCSSWEMDILDLKSAF